MNKSFNKIKIILLFALLILSVSLFVACGDNNDTKPTTTDKYIFTTPKNTGSNTPNTSGTIATSTPTMTPTPTPTPTPIISAYPTNGTEPEKHGMKVDITVDGNWVTNYSRDQKIFFGEADEYANVNNGIFSFRGNNYRNTSGVFGSQNISEAKFNQTPIWTQSVGSLKTTTGEGWWSGCGWTGQPLVQEWPKSTRQIMKMYDWAKEQEKLTEVIVSAQDGKIHFFEFETGKRTRDPIACNIVFKGGGSLDPRGIPLMYLGSGDISPNGTYPSAYVVNLVTNEVVFEFGRFDSFAYRSWYGFDSSPIVDAETDTLIYAGENGIIYFIKLGTKYDEAAGTLSINPSVTKFRYKGNKSSLYKYKYGFEDSPMAFQNYLYIADNGGYLMCIDVNTLKVVWVQDIKDDTNCTGVLEVENGIPYIYISTAYLYGYRVSNGTPAPVPIYKINAQTGEIVWQIDYECRTTDGQSGGAQGSLALGQGSLDNIVYVPLAKTPNYNEGKLVAIDTNTGKEIWSFKLTNYTWSSPSLIYDKATGKGYVIIGDVNGKLFLLDGLTGKLCDTIQLNGTIEASPAIYNNTILLGSRNCTVYALEIK